MLAIAFIGSTSPCRGGRQRIQSLVIARGVRAKRAESRPWDLIRLIPAWESEPFLLMALFYPCPSCRYPQHCPWSLAGGPCGYPCLFLLVPGPGGGATHRAS